MGYVLGVDGGNTKTDYLLYTTDGALVAHVRAGTCSHENLGMDGAREEMDRQIAVLMERAGIARADVAAAAFGLAGIDQALQKAALTEIVRGFGFENSVAANDSFLGIKAGSPSGVGICSINGTGTASGGIDAGGAWMQVGGIGALSGDDAGGAYIAGRVARVAYDEVFRFGPRTAMTPRVLALMGCADTPDDLHTAISTKYQYGHEVTHLQLIEVLLACCGEGDAVAAELVRYVADTLARSAAGCAARLRFDGAVPVVLIGSVWTKGRYPPMIEHFSARFMAYSGKEALLHILDVPPAIGSILWALELATGAVPMGALRERVLASGLGL